MRDVSTMRLYPPLKSCFIWLLSASWCGMAELAMVEYDSTLLVVGSFCRSSTRAFSSPQCSAGTMMAQVCDLPNALSITSPSILTCEVGDMLAADPYVKLTDCDARSAGTASTAAITSAGTAPAWHTFAMRWKERKNGLCMVFATSPRMLYRMHGIRSVMEKSEHTMPLASAMPMSAPIRNCMAPSERKPKNVTAAELRMTGNDLVMALTMASNWSSVLCCARPKFVSSTME